PPASSQTTSSCVKTCLAPGTSRRPSGSAHRPRSKAQEVVHDVDRAIGAPDKGRQRFVDQTSTSPRRIKTTWLHRERPAYRGLASPTLEPVPPGERGRRGRTLARRAR